MGFSATIVLWNHANNKFIILDSRVNKQTDRRYARGNIAFKGIVGEGVGM